MRILLLLTLAAASAMAQVTSVPAATGTSTGGASADGTVQKGNGSGGFSGTSVTDNGTTVSTSEPIAAKSATTGDGTASGIQCVNGLTSGSVCFAAADTAGTAIAYIYPATNGAAGQVMKDNGVTTCPTLPSGSPATCHQMAWTTAGGAGTLLCTSATASSTTSSTSEANLQTCTIPAGTLTTTSRVVVIFVYKFVGINGLKTPVIRLSTTSGDTTTGFDFFDSQTPVVNTLSQYNWAQFMNVNSVSVQAATNTGTVGNSNNANIAGAINTANISYLNFNCKLASASDTCQIVNYSVLVY